MRFLPPHALLCALASFCAVTPVAAQNSVSQGAFNLTTTQVSVGSTATQVAPARITRTQVAVTNPSATAVFCGPTSAVTVSTGFELLGTATVPAVRWLPYTGALWCIVASATQTVTVDDVWN